MSCYDGSDGPRGEGSTVLTHFRPDILSMFANSARYTVFYLRLPRGHRQYCQSLQPRVAKANTGGGLVYKPKASAFKDHGWGPGLAVIACQRVKASSCLKRLVPPTPDVLEESSSRPPWLFHRGLVAACRPQQWAHEDDRRNFYIPGWGPRLFPSCPTP